MSNARGPGAECSADLVSSKIVGRVIVGVDGSPGSLAALRCALDQARRFATVLVPVMVWHPPGARLTAGRAPSPHYTSLLREYAETELRRSFNEGLGAVPHDVPLQPRVTTGPPGPALVGTADRSHDLLVVGAGRRGGIRHALHAGTARYCLAHAVCPVIAVPPPRLQAELPTRLRRRREIAHLGDL